MSKYEVKSVVCDYGVFEDNELKVICNSHANALTIKEILETDSDMSKPYVWQDQKIEELEKQLAEQPKQIVQKIKEYCHEKAYHDSYGDYMMVYERRYYDYDEEKTPNDDLMGFLENLLKDMK